MTHDTSPADLARWRANLQSEVDGSHVYRAMAANAGDDRLAELYSRMADAEDRHAELWRGRVGAVGGASAVEPTWRARALAAIARRFGAASVAPTVSRQERDSRTAYDDQVEASGTSLPADERSHARLLRVVTGGAPGSVLARFEGRHRAIGGNGSAPPSSARTTVSSPTSAS